MDALVKAGGWDTASPAQVTMLHRYPLLTCRSILILYILKLCVMTKYRQVRMSEGGYACIDGMHRTTAMQRNLDLGVLDGKVYAIVYKEDTPDDVVVGLATGTITLNDLVALICLLKQIHF